MWTTSSTVVPLRLTATSGVDSSAPGNRLALTAIGLALGRPARWAGRSSRGFRACLVAAGA